MSLKGRGKREKPPGKLHVSEAAWASVMRTRERPNGDQIAQGLAPSRPLPILLKERPRTGCIREESLSPPGPSLPSSQPELRGWKLKEEGDQVDCFQWEAAGSGERAKVSWSQPPLLWLPQATQSVGQPPPTPQVPGPLARKGQSGHSGAEGNLGCTSSPRGFPAHPKRQRSGSPHPGMRDTAPPSGAPV